jgi:hypothetical protein
MGIPVKLTAVAIVVSLCFGAAPAVFADPAPATSAPPAATTVVPDPAAWQGVISGQIEAFRKGDAPTAFSYAGSAFQKTFTDPAQFMLSIAASGYAPIFTSVSHQFGGFAQPDDKTVVQNVTLIGPNREVYKAIYALALEPTGWRVQGVELMKDDSIGV